MFSRFFVALSGVCDSPCSVDEVCVEINGKYQCACKLGFQRVDNICSGMRGYMRCYFVRFVDKTLFHISLKHDIGI